MCSNVKKPSQLHLYINFIRGLNGSVGTVLLALQDSRISTGHNGRTTACVDLQSRRDGVTGMCISSFLIDTSVVFLITPEIEKELERVFHSIAKADDGIFVVLSFLLPEQQAASHTQVN